MFLQHIFNKLKISKDIPLVVGCSAGPDSMALLHYLKNNTENKIICCHINHNVRKESKTEEKYLKNYCKQENIIFEGTKIEKFTQKNFENEARQKRYSFYKEILNKYNTKYLFLAHHGDDLIETILMKITRGSNIEGYAGIKEIAKKDNYFIIRPFLTYSKNDLLNYNHKHNILYYLDRTNEDTTYTRNRFRKNILPLLKEENPNIHKQFLKYSNTLLEYHHYIEKQLETIIPTLYQKNQLNILLFQQQDLFIQKNILYKILNHIYNNTPNIITEQHIINILTLINTNKPNLTLNLPKNYIIKKEYNTLIFDIKKEKQSQTYKIPLQEVQEFGSIIIKKIKNTSENGNNICKLDSTKLNLPLYIRNRKNGDTIELKGSNQHKKIKEIFIEKKISKEKRDNYPILVDNNDQIIWLPNLKKSKFDSQNNEFYDIILKYCEKEENNEQ